MKGTIKDTWRARPFPVLPLLAALLLSGILACDGAVPAREDNPTPRPASQEDSAPGPQAANTKDEATPEPRATATPDQPTPAASTVPTPTLVNTASPVLTEGPPSLAHRSDAGVSPTFTTVAVGFHSNCGIRPDGSVYCWGRNVGTVGGAEGFRNVLVAPPPGSFKSMALSVVISCGIRPDDSLYCNTWGGNFTLSGPFKSVRIADVYPFGTFCALRMDGTVMCQDIGTDDAAVSVEVPEVRFREVPAIRGRSYKGQALEGFACGVEAEGGYLNCWGPSSHPPEEAFGIEFLSVTVGDEHACALRADGIPLCWTWSGRADVEEELLTTPPEGSAFAAVEAGANFTCGLEESGNISCWGVTNLDVPPGSFSSLSVNAQAYHACGLRSDGAPVCFGNDTYGVATAPGGSFASVDAGDTMLCGLRAGGGAYCIGEPRTHNRNLDASKLELPEGSYSHVSSHSVADGAAPVCGIAGGAVVCENGLNVYGEPNESYEWEIPAGSFTSVGVGSLFGAPFACGLATGGAAVCWGAAGFAEDADVIKKVPSGPFTSLSVGAFHVCGLGGGSITCWGRQDSQGRLPPSGSFSAVSVGSHLTCALKSEDHSLVCWGGDSGRASAALPEGAFDAVSVGVNHACGLRPSGAAECWAWGSLAEHDLGQADPPGGTFTNIAAGNDFTCGIRPDTSLVCWGWMVR